MKKQIVVLAALFMTMGLVACGSLDKAGKSKGKAHDYLTENQKLIACADCHKEATPKVHTEWFESTHGIGGVKCYQCHNTFGDIQKVPDVAQSCNSCHADKVDNKEHTEGLATCWECHGVHSFEAQ